jgi:starch synthase
MGLWAADAIVTVSPSYAREIMTRKYGMRLDSFFRQRRGQLHGILNGIDTAAYDPETDSALQVKFTADTLSARAANKAALQAELGLPHRADTLLMGVVSRMDFQKGTDLLLAALRSRALRGRAWQVVILGTGDPHLEAAAHQLEAQMPDRVRAAIRFDDRLARRIYGGCDLLLMPSRFEPCGLSQMMAMRYGCVPLVRAVGGLKDTVHPGRNGFAYDGAGAAALVRSIQEALGSYEAREGWQELQRTGALQDFSWDRSAALYADLYHSLLGGTGRETGLGPH